MNVTLGGAPLTSSTPLVMLPVPSAVKLPTAKRKLTIVLLATENAYWPFKAALENAMTVIVAEADFVVSALETAVTVIVAGLGAIGGAT